MINNYRWYTIHASHSNIHSYYACKTSSSKLCSTDCTKLRNGGGTTSMLLSFYRKAFSIRPSSNRQQLSPSLPARKHGVLYPWPANRLSRLCFELFLLAKQTQRISPLSFQGALYSSTPPFMRMNYLMRAWGCSVFIVQYISLLCWARACAGRKLRKKGPTYRRVQSTITRQTCRKTLALTVRLCLCVVSPPDNPPNKLHRWHGSCPFNTSKKGPPFYSAKRAGKCIRTRARSVCFPFSFSNRARQCARVCRV